QEREWQGLFTSDHDRALHGPGIGSAVPPGDVRAVERHYRQAHFARTLLNLAGMSEIDEGIVAGVVDAGDAEGLPDQRAPLLEYFLAAGAGADITNGDRADSGAIERRIGRVLEPIALTDPVDEGAVE